MISKWEINENIHSLSLKINSCTHALSLLQYTPNLKSYKLITPSFPGEKNLNERRNLSKIKLIKSSFICEQFHGDIPILEENFLRLTNAIKQFSLTLIYLSINLSQNSIYESDTFQFNGILLQQQLLESMIELKSFYLYSKLKQPLTNIENVLSTFENQFWFNHHWSIGMHGNYIYTLPFHFHQLDGFIDFDQIQSTNSMVCSSLQTWYHIRSLHLSDRFKLNINLIKQIKIKMPNLISLDVTSISKQHSKYSSIIEDDMNKIDTTLNSVTTVRFSGDFIEDKEQWLINFLPNFKHLILFGTVNFIQILNERIKTLKIYNVDFFRIWMENCHAPNLKHIEVNVYRYEKYDIVGVLKSLTSLETLLLHNLSYIRDSGYAQDSGLSKLIDPSNLIEILQDYQIKDGYKCILFVKKDRSIDIPSSKKSRRFWQFWKKSI